MSTDVDREFRQKILSSLKKVQSWDANTTLLQQCRDCIPWEELRNGTAAYNSTQLEQDRHLVIMINSTNSKAGSISNALFLQRLCRWFQKDFMTWVNAPPCVQCGSKECQFQTTRGPETSEETNGGAQRVEVYFCPQCNENTTTFPRYNNVQKLLETRRGRCGEFANLFGLFCRSVGFETRLVLDWSDHLWIEVRLGASDYDWVMADSCEGVIHKPSMYEHGWGKDGLSFMIATARDHVVDVTPRYTRKFLTNDFQTRRRNHTTSENATVQIIQQINQEIRQNLSLSKVALEELYRCHKLEQAELHVLQQSTEWTPQEKYGRGRISGSLAWKQSRLESGKGDSDNETKDAPQVAEFQLESFSPPIHGSPPQVSLQVRPIPIGRHDGIIVAGTPCAVGETDTVSVVVVDEKYLGCILQSKSFLTWADVEEFINRLPPHRILLIVGKCSKDGPSKAPLTFARLGGWKAGKDEWKEGIAYIGQVDANPDWTFFSKLADCPAKGYEVRLQGDCSHHDMQLRTERYVIPQRIAGRLPENHMPLKTQLVASEEQKRMAFLSFVKSHQGRYSGYTTKQNSPVYLLDATSYPFSKMDATTLEVVTKENAWNTFHFLPPALVPADDHGIGVVTQATETPKYDVPLEMDFFNSSLGTQLLTNGTTRLPTMEALHNARLVGLYFSAHWCGPCRSFTPMLAEMYAHLKEYRPTHGLEIVFASSDRDPASFQRYYGSMPWQAIPFDQLQMVKQKLSMTYGVRGIPSLVILDAVSGQVVIPPNEARQAVAMACRGGEEKIEAMLEEWLLRIPQESKEILSMLELSCEEENQSIPSNAKEMEYLYSEQKNSAPTDTASRVKELFGKLVSSGVDPTSAAAKAIEMVATEQQSPHKLEPGSLNGKASHCGIVCDDDAVDQAIAHTIENNSPAVVADVLATALKYVNNARKEPWSSKFRTFRVSNKVADQIARVDGGLALLESLGFEVVGTSQDFKVNIPLSTDLDAMNQAMLSLIEGLQSNN